MTDSQTIQIKDIGEVRLEKSRRAKRIVISVRPGKGVRVAVPKRISFKKAAQFARTHGRRLRVATKYMSLTRRFFAAHGVTGYRIVESAGATEATPAAGTSELIVDITTTGTTLRANHLKVLEDGLILKSQAQLFASRGAKWSKPVAKLRDAIVTRLSA